MKKSTAEVLAELTGDDRTETEAATHSRITVEPCACDQDHDHIEGEQ